MTPPILPFPPLDPFARFRTATRARIGLGRSGDALPTPALLDFQMAHALARDAVYGSVDWDALVATLPGEGTGPVIAVHSDAPDRATYLRRPDLGRRLDSDSPARLARAATTPCDLAVVIADGLSAAAVQVWAAPVIHELLVRIPGWAVRIVTARQARVALGDPIGHALQATLAAVLIGERPGLSVADSLGIYLTYDPRPGRKDSERNCLSNIHANGLSPALAAEKLVWLMTEARRRRLTGVDLKEETPTLESTGAPVPLPHPP